MATTGTTGAVANSYKYDPYGGIVTETETSIRPTSFRFAGGLYSSSVGLHKFGARWYDQALDRWTQQDPIDQTRDLQAGNRYLYVSDNPTNQTDPSGLTYTKASPPGHSPYETYNYYQRYYRSVHTGGLTAKDVICAGSGSGAAGIAEKVGAGVVRGGAVGFVVALGCIAYG
jgi:RHS repeat-associated protein